MNEFILGVLVGSAVTFGITFAIAGKTILNSYKATRREFVGPINGVVYMAPPGVALVESQVHRLCHLSLAERSVALIGRFSEKGAVPTIVAAVNLISVLRRTGFLNESKLEEMSESEVADCFLVPAAGCKN